MFNTTLKGFTMTQTTAIELNKRHQRNDVTSALGVLHRAYSEYTLKAYHGSDTAVHKAAVKQALKKLTTAADLDVSELYASIIND
jgi:hypothetical protein